MGSISKIMPDLFLDLKVTYKGELIHHHKEEGHSWTRNGWNFMAASSMDCLSFGEEFKSGNLTGKNITGTVYSSDLYVCIRYSVNLANGGFSNWGNTNSFGLVVGTSDSKFYTDDYCLYEMIGAGNGPGQLFYMSQNDSPQITSYDSTSNTFSTLVKRIFNNNSGGDITIKELGLTYYGYMFSNSLQPFLFTRDILETPVTIPNGAQFTAQYLLITPPFTECDSDSVPDFPAVGTSGSGGTFLGIQTGWTHPHHVYALILSPYTGGDSDSTTLQFKDNLDLMNNYELEYGFLFMPDLYILGAASQMGQFCADANTSELNGYSDWYIPAFNELFMAYTFRDSIPEGEKLTSSTYWSSSIRGAAFTTGRGMLSSGSVTYLTFTLTNKVRLVRRIHIKDWIPN